MSSPVQRGCLSAHESHICVRSCRTVRPTLEFMGPNSLTNYKYRGKIRITLGDGGASFSSRSPEGLVSRGSKQLVEERWNILHLFVTNPSYFLHTSQSYFKCDLIQEPWTGHTQGVPPTRGCQIASRVGAGAVWMSGWDASPCDLPERIALDAVASLARRVGASVAHAHPGGFPVSTRFVVDAHTVALHDKILLAALY
jgi:hypothetical protein